MKNFSVDRGALKIAALAIGGVGVVLLVFSILMGPDATPEQMGPLVVAVSAAVILAIRFFQRRAPRE